MHVGHPGDSGFLALSAMWFGMMALMMAPTAWPWVSAFRRAVDPALLSSAAFSGGYLSAWLAWSAAAAAVQIGLLRTAGADPLSGLGGLAGGAVLAGAGVYQFAPLKRACLTHCRNPFSYFLARWPNGPSGGFRLGLGHGLYCVGCCWALMATSLAVGMANLWWMAALTAVVFLEQVAPRGDRLRAPLGLALVIAGIIRM